MLNRECSPIIYIWTGSEIPWWSYSFIRHVQRYNSGREIIIITDRPQKKVPRDIGGIIDNVGADYIDPPSKNAISSKSGFWHHTSLRLFILSKYCIERSLENVFHIELDNIINNISGLEERLCTIGSGIFAPRDSLTRVIGSLIYINRVDSLLRLIDVYKTYGASNDMEALGKFATINPEEFFALPTESYSYNKHLFDIVPPERVGGIFDAASIGQYLLGIDPIHARYKPTKNMFINENCYYDWDHGDNIKLNDHTLYLRVTSDIEVSEHQTVYNIHAHCKNYSAVLSLLRGKRIWKNLVLGKKSIVGKRYLLILGPTNYMYDWFKTYVRNGIKSIIRYYP